MIEEGLEEGCLINGGREVVIIIGGEEGEEVAFAVDDVGSGGEEGEEEENETGLSTLGTGLFDRNRGRLEGGESRGIFLDLRLGQTQLSGNLGVGLILEVHLVFEFGEFATSGLEQNIAVGIDMTGMGAAGLFVTLLGLGIEFLVIFQIDTGLLGAVVGNKFLKVSLY